MRQSRLRIDTQDTWYHCYNRIAGTSKDLPFGDIEKEQFVRILKRVSLLYTVQVVSYQVMSNHFHLLVKALAAEPNAEEVCERYKAFHRGKRELDSGSEVCRIWQGRCRDISWFMRHVQQLFTSWYNRTRPIRRRGSLWADRFKHTILEDSVAVWSCWKYIETNPVRAGMVGHASDYRFCSYGAWVQTGRHPFEENVVKTILLLTEGLFGLKSLHDLKKAFSTAIAEEGEAVQKDGFSLTTRRRVRHWTQGLIIGSELFIRNAMSARKPHRMSAARSGDQTIYAWRKLRPSLE